MNPPAQERLNQTSRLTLHSDVTALGLLTSPAAVARLKVAVGPLTLRDSRSFLRGYRLAVAVPLQGLLRFVVDYADLLGLENDDTLSNWLHFRSPARGESLVSAVSEPTSDLSRLCHVFNDLHVAMRSDERGLIDTIAAIEKCRVVARAFDEVLAGTEIVSLDTGDKLPYGESLARLCLAERVLDYAEYARSIVPLTYESIWSGGKEFRSLDDSFILDAETHLDSIALFPISKGVPKEWLNGLRFGFDLVVTLSGVALPPHSDPDSNHLVSPVWLNELRSFTNPAYPRPEGQWPSMKYGLTGFAQSNPRRLLGHFEVNMNTASSRHRLTAILGSDRVRLMADADATAALELEVMLSGAVAAHRDSRVHLLRLTHSVDSDDREWVSLAFRLPMYGFFSNASKWFFFYKIYHTGHVLDTDVARAMKTVEGLLLRFKDNLQLEEISDLDSQDFLPLCVSPAFRAMRELSRAAVETNAALRSVNSELLAAFWLVEQGYSHVKVSFKHALLGNYEYDAIGVKDRHCLVVEVTGANIIDRKLQEKIERFADKVENLRGQMPELRQALSSDSEINNVSGQFIFLGDLRRFKSVKPSISLWGYDDFVKALKALGLPDRIVGLLDRSHIVHSIQTSDFPHDPFFSGLEDSSMEED